MNKRINEYVFGRGIDVTMVLAEAEVPFTDGDTSVDAAWNKLETIEPAAMDKKPNCEPSKSALQPQRRQTNLLLCPLTEYLPEMSP